MLSFLILLFTVVPALEFYLLFSIGSQIGAGNTFLIIILTGVIGAFLAKLQGLSVLMNIQETLNKGQIPATDIVHGFIVFGGGLLLLTPGFLTDVLGFCMVIPGTRHLIVLFLMNYFKKGVASGNIRFFTSVNIQSRGFEYEDNSIEADFTKKED
jgi:UPF0716 protein FxsA